MAIDAYLQIDGIKGESAESAHQGWIEITWAHRGVTQPRSATVSSAGGNTSYIASTEPCPFQSWRTSPRRS